MTPPTAVDNRIGGELRPGSGPEFESRDPADWRRVVSTSRESGADDVRAAVDAALDALPGWAATAAPRRAKLLEAAAALLARDAAAIAAEMVAEMGKPRSDAHNEVLRTADNLRLAAGEALRLQGRTFPVDETTVLTLVEPVGVVGVITPWNFPLSLAGRKIGPALAAGNTVVFKPSPVTPLMGERLAAALDEAGLPPGALQVVHGFDAGRHLVEDTRVDAITFTGSTAVGRLIDQASGFGRRVQLELGGNNPVVVLADADPAAAAAVVAKSAFALSGQACTAAGRVIVDERIHDEVLELVVERAERLRVGPGEVDGVDMGPLVDGRAVGEMERVVDEAVGKGARVATGGRRLEGGDHAHGWFYPPTVLADVDPAMEVSSNEVFGPVIGFERVSGLDEALARANATEYGLTAAVCTRDLGTALRMARELQAGIVRVNRPTVGTPLNAPFGGIKSSGTAMHKEQLGPTMIDFYTRQRTLVLGD